MIEKVFQKKCNLSVLPYTFCYGKIIRHLCHLYSSFKKNLLILFSQQIIIFQIADMMRFFLVYTNILVDNSIDLFCFTFRNWNELFLACGKGYNGTNCSMTCPYPTYGQNCQSNCNCIFKDCDHRNGCNRTKGGK